MVKVKRSRIDRQLVELFRIEACLIQNLWRSCFDDLDGSSNKAFVGTSCRADFFDPNGNWANPLVRIGLDLLRFKRCHWPMPEVVVELLQDDVQPIRPRELHILQRRFKCPGQEKRTKQKLSPLMEQLIAVELEIGRQQVLVDKCHGVTNLTRIPKCVVILFQPVQTLNHLAMDLHPCFVCTLC